MLIQRIITAFIFGTLIIVGVLYLPLTSFRMLAISIVALAAWEFAGLFWQNDYKKKVGFLVVLLLAVALASFFPAQPTLIMGVLWWLVAPYFFLSSRYVFKRDPEMILKVTLVGILIFVPCTIGLIEIQEKFGAAFTLYLLAIICAADIGAYFTGMFCGKHLLAYQISPKKTLEGLVGGLLFALIIAIVGVFTGKIAFDFSGMRGISLLTLVIITCLWSVIGDLFESMLKRQAGVKDSGQLLPGHGGMYDRIDSLTAAIPIFVLGLLLI